MADGGAPEPVCVECGAVLTEEESRFYEYRCEACEQTWLEHMRHEQGRCGFCHHLDPTQPIHDREQLMVDPRFKVSAQEGKPEWWNSDHWATPPSMVRELEAEFGAFDLDPCCMPDTAKAPRYFTPDDNGLKQPWHGRVFLNPPYSRPGPWLAKAITETMEGRASLVVALIPGSTDTRWFHDYVKDYAEIRFIRGRVRFIGWQRTPIPAPKAPSLYAVYRPGAECKRCGLLLENPSELRHQCPAGFQTVPSGGNVP